MVDVQCAPLENPHQPYDSGYSHDISIGGIGVVLQDRMEIGSLLEVAFRIPGTDKEISVTGKVAWVEEFTVGSDKTYDTGIEFVNVSQEAVDAIQSFARGAVRPPS